MSARVWLVPAPLERVLSEFADPVARARWSAPSEDVLIYDEADFRIGGKDGFRCGPKGDPKFRGETRYLVIVPNARVVSSETLDMDGQRLAVSLTTLDFEPAVKLVAFAGPGMIHGYESGTTSALENLSSISATCLAPEADGFMNPPGLLSRSGSYTFR